MTPSPDELEYDRLCKSEDQLWDKLVYLESIEGPETSTRLVARMLYSVTIKREELSRKLASPIPFLCVGEMQ